MTEKVLSQLRTALHKSSYAVALCGSGCLKECGVTGLKSQEHAYSIEEKYGDSPEYLYTSAYFSSRPKQFYAFYKNEFLSPLPDPSPTAHALAALEQEGLLHAVITSNVFDLPRRAGCKNVINLHGTVYDNYCSHCGQYFPLDYILQSTVPLCGKCGHIIRPGVSFFGDMIDNALITKTVEEIEKADLLFLLGTSLRSEVFHDFFNYFNGRTLAVIHDETDISDTRADILICKSPKDVLPQLL